MRLTICPLCDREAPRSRHHLTPRSQARRKKRKKAEEDPVVLAGLCVDCHGKIHSLFANRVLAEQYSTVEKLKTAPGVEEWLAFISKRPSTARFISRRSSAKN